MASTKKAPLLVSASSKPSPSPSTFKRKAADPPKKQEEETYAAKRAREEREAKEMRAERLKDFGAVQLPKPKNGYTWLVYLIGNMDCEVDRFVGQVKTTALEELEGYTEESGDGWLRALLQHQDEAFGKKADDLVESGNMDEYDEMVSKWFQEEGGAPELCKYGTELGHENQWTSIQCKDGPLRVMYGVSSGCL